MPTAYRYVKEGITLLAVLAPILEQAMQVAAGKAYVIIDGSLLRIDRVAMASGKDPPYYSGKHKCHGINVHFISDAVGRLVWVSPPSPGARHDVGAARDQGILDAMQTTGVRALGDTGYQGRRPFGHRAPATSSQRLADR